LHTFRVFSSSTHMALFVSDKKRISNKNASMHKLEGGRGQTQVLSPCAAFLKPFQTPHKSFVCHHLLPWHNKSNHHLGHG
jgi:hypothetical protein